MTLSENIKAIIAALTHRINSKEDLSNKTDVLSSSSTSTQYPSASATYTAIQNVMTEMTESLESYTPDVSISHDSGGYYFTYTSTSNLADTGTVGSMQIQ